MTIKNLHSFLIDYFEANQCFVEYDDTSLDIKLTEEMDEKLLNRPFYWHYMRKLNQKGTPLDLKLTTDFSKETKDRHYINFVTEQFQKIAQDTLSKGRFVKLYQKVEATSQTAFYPWLAVNLKLSYLGNTHNEEIKSYAIHLINGTIIDHAFQWLKEREWLMKIPDLCYTISPIIKPENGFNRIENYLINELQSQEHQWAKESYRLLTEEISLLDYFKKHQTMDNDHYEQEKNNLNAIYHPKIKIEVINGGLLYLSQT